MKKRLIFTISSLLFVQGCSVKSLNKSFKNYVDKNYVEPTSKERSYLKNKVHQNIIHEKYIDLSIKKSLSTILKELSEIDGNVYILKSSDIDIEPCTNSQKLHIDSFKKLNQYIQDTTNLTMIVTKNRFYKNRAKIIELKDLHSIESNLNQIPFYLKGAVSITDALNEMSKLTGFSIVYKTTQDTTPNTSKEPSLQEFDSPTPPVNSFFEGKYTFFSGNNVANFLNLLSNNFNLFVDVDYKNKLIIFSKKKSKIFHIFVNNINMSGSLSGQKTVTGVNANSSNLPITSQVTINILEDLNRNLTKLIAKSPGSLFSFNKTSGQIFVKTDKRTMESITKFINDFNAIFNKQIDFQLDVYEFVVNKNFTYGVSVGGKITRDQYTVSTNGGESNDLIKKIFHITKNGSNVHADAEATNNIIQLLQATNHGYTIKNNMPYMIDLTNSKNYVKTITTTINHSVSGDTQVTTPETATISDGTILTVLPRIVGKRIELNIEPNIVTINKISKETYDGNTISLPDISTNKFKSNITLQSGERRIIGYVTQYQDVSDYNGIMPLNHFIIGGENNKKYIRKEIVFVVGAKISE